MAGARFVKVIRAVTLTGARPTLRGLVVNFHTTEKHQTLDLERNI